MKTKECLVAFAASFACLFPAAAQDDPTAEPIPAADLPDAPPAPPAAAGEPAADPADPADPIDPLNPADPADPVAEGEEEVPDPIDLNDTGAGAIEEAEDGGLKLTGVELNAIFEYLAKEGGFGYLANSRLVGPEFQITGSIPAGDPVEQMRAIAQFSNIELYTDRGIIYALDQSQLGQLPSEQWTYQLKYLRPDDIDSIKSLLTPLLTPGAIVNYEAKTNTIIIIDTTKKIAAVEELLAKVDKAKGQIVIETKILRSNRLSGTATGIDWSTSLGRNSGVSLDVISDLNDLFGLGDFLGPYPVSNPGFASQGGGGGGANQGFVENNGAGLVLSPVQFTGVLRALRDANCAKQEGNPTLITEDNEEALLSIIDRVPIITQTQSTGLAGGLATEEVRYTIDEADPTIADDDPTKTREIGVTVSVRPTLLPDNTIRMKLRPRSAQITDQIQGSNPGVTFPRVQESTIETISRVPNNHTLLLGGFYSLVETNNKTKVPILGDIPVINFLFKSDVKTEEQTSLVFCVTPKAYDPSSISETKRVTSAAKARVSNKERCTYLDCDEDACEHDQVPAATPYSAKGQEVHYSNTSHSNNPRMNPFSRRR